MSAKGGEFERGFCRELSRWWTGGEHDDFFWRTSGSGAQAKTRSKTGKRSFGQYGDIQAVHPDGRPLLEIITIECKRGYKKWNPLDILDKPANAAKQKIEEFLEQAEEDCRNAGAKYPVLVFRRDRRECCIAFPRPLYVRLDHYCGEFPEGHPYFIFRQYNDMSYVCVLLASFFEWCSPEVFMKLRPMQPIQMQPHVSRRTK